MTSRRSLQTILFTDIVGSTERAVELGDHAWRDLLARHHAAVRREIGRFGGREINTAGDGFFVAFDHPDSAIRCAWSIREALRELDLEIRAGVHMGSVDHHGADLGGLGVHVGARIAACAEPGEILVSNAVHESEIGSGFGFADRDEHELKGVPGTWRLHAVESVPERSERFRPARRLPAWIGSRAAMVAATVGFVVVAVLAARALFDGGGPDGIVPTATAGAAPAIAVLPFEVRGDGQDLWREGMIDVLSTNLDGVAGLRAVSSRTVLARWREVVPVDSTPDARSALAIARRTGARFAVIGSLIDTGDHLRIVTETYDLETDGSLGRAQVEGAADSVLGLVDRLSVEILRTMGARSEGLVAVDLAQVTTQSLPALRAYLRGEAHLRSGRFEPAAEAFREAVAADSTFALAWLSLGEAYRWSDLSRLDEAWTPALRLVDRLPERKALLLRANAETRLGGTPKGLELLREATRRFPDDAQAWFGLGDYMWHFGPALLVDPWETRRAFTRSIELDPGFSPAHIHAIDLRMRLAPDSAAVTRLLDAYARHAPGTEDARQIGALVSYAFGTDSTQAAVMSVLDTLVVNPWWVYLNYSHPRFFADKTRILRRLRASSEPNAETRLMAWMYADELLHRGRIDAALEATEHSLVDDLDWGGRLYLARVSGLPVPEERLERALAYREDPSLRQPAAGRNPPAAALFLQAAWALERGRRDDYAASLARAREIAASAWAEADTSAARYADGVVSGLSGLRAWKAGDPETAERRLDAARLATNGAGLDPVKKLVRWWLARIALETGRDERAAELFLSLSHGEDAVGEPLALLELARVQEKLGRLEEAQANYELFALAWKDADPELRPLVEEALEAAARVERT